MTPLEAFAAGGEERIYWRGPDGRAMAGLGVARELEVHGEDRFETAAAKVSAMLAPSELAFAGFAFADGDWPGYPAGRVVVPAELLVASCDSGAAPAPATNVPDSQPQAEKLRLVDDSRAAYLRTASAAATAVAAGEMAKVVVARAVQAQGSIHPSVLLGRLQDRFDSCAVFGFGRGPHCFVGASPEVLVEVRDGTVTTCALAGTAPRGGTPAEDIEQARRLADNPKDQAEHRYVVDYLRTRLALAGVDLQPASPTVVRTLPGVHHLQTTVTGSVTPRPGLALELVGALHPTPAVGGTPSLFAQRWIAANEGLDRGWYAGPVGWIDHQGCGSFYVALRSALADPDGLRLFAGAGIVAGSDPQRELAETDTKLAAILDVVT